MKTKKLATYLVMVVSTVFYSCAGAVKSYDTKKDDAWNKDNVYAVLPFVNYTETPQAGKRVASILYAIMIDKGYKVKNNIVYLKQKNLKTLEKEAFENGADYVVTGTVNEYRYKTGIDGQPAVSVSIMLINKNNNVVWSATGSQTGLINSSLGKITTTLLKSLIP